MEVYRRTVHQRVLCGTCGESFFILPADCYPVPAPPKSPKSTPKRTEQPAGSAADESESRPASPDVGTESGTSVAVNGSPDAGTGKTVGAPKRVRVVTLFRVMVVLIVSVVVTTGYWSVRVRAVDRAGVAFKDASDRGFQSLSRGEFVEASEAFQQACDALELLGRDDLEARRVRQMSRETTASASLASVSLSRIMQDVVDDGDPQQLFRGHYSGTWVIFDTFVERKASTAARPRDVIDFPLFVRGRPVVIESQLPALDKIGLSDQPRRVIFAAQLGSCRAPLGGKDAWVIQLRPKTAFLWTDRDNLRRLGFAPLDEEDDRQIDELLQAQAQTVGLSP